MMSEQTKPALSDVFISYSRRDSDFMRRLFEALKTHNFDAWVDWEDIPKGENFLQEIETGIEGAHTFLLIMSPNSLSSEICNHEIRHAIQHHKRIIPVICADFQVDNELHGDILRGWFGQDWESTARENWQVLRHLNWIFFRESDDFDHALHDLLNTLNTDIDHVKYHRRLTVRAVEWQKEDQKAAFLLRGDDLSTAEGWLAISEHKSPAPTTLHREYIEASRTESDTRAAMERKRLRNLAQARFGLALAIALVALLGVIFALVQADTERSRVDEVEALLATSVAAQATSEQQFREASSRNLADSAQNALDDGDFDLALALALEAVSVPNPPVRAQAVLYSAVDAAPRRVFEGHTDFVWSVAFSPDGQTALFGSCAEREGNTCTQGEMRLWEVATGETLRVFQGHTDDVNSVAFSPDGQTALSGSRDETLRLWDVATGETLRVFQGHTDWVRSVAFSPDGQTALSGSCAEREVVPCIQGEMRLWDVATGETLRVFQGHTDDVNSVAFSPDGQTALSSSWDETLRLWDVATGETLRVFQGHAGNVTSVAFSPDGQTALSASSDNTLRLWDVATGQTLRVFDGHTFDVNSVAFSPDGQTALSGSSDGTLRLWDVATGETLRVFDGHNGAVWSVAFSPDGQTALSGYFDDTLRLWDVATGETLRVFEGHNRAVWSVAFSPDGQTALSGSGDGTLRLWDVATGETLRVFDGHNGAVRSVAFSPDGQTALSGSGDDTLRLWEVATGHTLRVFQGHTDWVWSVAFSPDGQTALSGSRDETLRLWDVATGETLRVFEGHTFGVSSVAFSPDGQTALSGSWDDTLRLWEVATGQTLRVFQGHAGNVTSVAFSPDGQTALSGSCAESEGSTCTQGEIRLWDVATGETLRIFEGHTDEVNSVAFSPDGQTALSASDDGTLRLWDVATGETLRIFDGHTNWVLSVAFSPDGQTALSGSDDNTLRLWRIDPLDERIAWAYENRHVRELTCEERLRYNTFVQCDVSSSYPTNTPFATFTPSATLTPSAP